MAECRVSPWAISLSGGAEDFAQSVFFLGNGYLGVRGFSPLEEKRCPWDHALFRAGLFEEIRPGVTDMVLLPDPLGLRVSLPLEVTGQELDMRAAVLTQHVRGEGLSGEMRRMVSMADRQLICQTLTLRAERAVTFRIRSVMDEAPANLPVHDDQMIEATEAVRLLETLYSAPEELRLRTVHSGREVRILAEVTPASDLTVSLEPGGSVTVEKRVRVLVGGEAPNPDSTDPWADHRAAWARLWRDCDVLLEGDDRLQGAIRYNVLQLLCNNAAEDAGVSIGARGINHGRYKGNTFWDTEIFLLPFYCWHRPAAARNLVRYRLDRLDAAREIARRQNLRGARFPWMCSTDGLEQCESWDIGLCETHVTADVAYAADRYRQITGDDTLDDTIAAMYRETARYWLSRFTWEEGKGQYSSFFVKGPDEYCGAAVNNTYTNYMARHNVLLALPHAGQEEAAFRHFAEHVTLLYDPARELYLQDELFERLEPMPPRQEEGEALYKTVCFDRMQRYRALKQADLVLLMTLFPRAFTPGQKQAAWNYYEPLTVHDSSLSYGSHALLAFQLGMKEEAMAYFRKSLLFDLEDVLHNTGREGIHMAALGVSWQALVYGMLGLWSEKGELTLSPCLPRGVERVSLAVYHRGERLRITAGRQGCTIEKEA